MEMELKGVTYEMATSLRVAYKIQGMNNNKSYAKVFEGVGDMGIEEQIGLLYASFSVANPGTLSKQEFLDAVLDEYGIAQVMEKLSELIEAMMFRGMTDKQVGEYRQRLEQASQK